MVETVGVSMPEIIEALEGMFEEKGKGRVEMPPKPGIHPRRDAFIHASKERDEREFRSLSRIVRHPGGDLLPGWLHQNFDALEFDSRKKQWFLP